MAGIGYPGLGSARGKAKEEEEGTGKPMEGSGWWFDAEAVLHDGEMRLPHSGKRLPACRDANPGGNGRAMVATPE